MPPKGQAKRGREEDEEAQKPATKQRAGDAKEEEEEVGVVAGDLCVGTPPGRNSALASGTLLAIVWQP
jgi:hypothetical protein